MSAARVVDADPIAILVACRDRFDRLACASAARAMALRVGMPKRSCDEVGIAAAELASNVARHGGGGALELSIVLGPRRALEILARDGGPGIADVEAALRDGWSAGRMLGPDDSRSAGLGSGLGAVRRVMDELSIETGPSGTIIRARKWY